MLIVKMRNELTIIDRISYRIEIVKIRRCRNNATNNSGFYGPLRRSKQIITYCDIGQCCPTWTFILKQVLGYQDVRVYDGALQEWGKDPLAPFEK